MAPATRVLWLFPVSFAVHEGEELLTLAAWVQEHSNSRPLRQLLLKRRG
jgi:hypothetical protein